MPKVTEPVTVAEPGPVAAQVRIIKLVRDINNVGQIHKDSHEIIWEEAKRRVKYRAKQKLEDGTKQRWRVVFEHQIHYLELDGE
jgi:hypothetical protein